MKTKSKFSKSYLMIIFLIIYFLHGCSNIEYKEKKIQIKEITSHLKQINYQDSNFIQYLIKNGYSETELPFSSWGLNELIHAQQFFNPRLKTGKINWELAKTNEVIANLRPLSSLGIKVGKSDGDGQLSDKIFDTVFSFTFEPANKRLIRHEIALNKTQLSLIDREMLHWQLREDLLDGLFRFINNQDLINTVRDELHLKQSILSMVKKRLDLGVVSQVDYDRQTLNLNQVDKELFELQIKQSELKKKLASVIGLTIEQFNLIPIKTKEITIVVSKKVNNYLQNTNTIKLENMALLNRVDLRHQLAIYAITEANLKLEIAEQYPDIAFSPAYAYDFGNQVWVLGVDTLIKTSDRNKAFITRAEKLRESEASKIFSIQLNMLNEVDILLLSHTRNKETLNTAQSNLKIKVGLIKKLQTRFDMGVIDRLDLEREKINLINIDKDYHKAIYNFIRTGLEAEKVLQNRIFSPNIKFNL